MLYPVKNGEKYVGSKFGPRDGGFHSGVDFKVPVRTELIAVDDMELAYVMYNADGYGFYLVFESLTCERCYLYAHIDKRAFDEITWLKSGKRFKAGESLGKLSGNSGNSTGPHLHFEVRECEFDTRTFFTRPGGKGYPKYKAVDPLLYLEVKKEEVLDMPDYQRKSWDKAVKAGVEDGLYPGETVTAGKLMVYFDKIGLLDEILKKQGNLI